MIFVHYLSFRRRLRLLLKAKLFGLKVGVAHERRSRKMCRLPQSRKQCSLIGPLVSISVFYECFTKLRRIVLPFELLNLRTLGTLEGFVPAMVYSPFQQNQLIAWCHLAMAHECKQITQGYESTVVLSSILCDNIP